jgi:DNA-binding MarR family transcriptional regulator
MMAHAVSLSNALFSKMQQRVLALIFTHPERSFYTSEIVRHVHSGVGAVERELSKLERSGLVSRGTHRQSEALSGKPSRSDLRGIARPR